MISDSLFFPVSLLSSLAFTEIATLIGRRLKWMDMPSQLSIHSRPVPRTGGLGIGLAFLMMSVIAGALGLLNSDGAGVLLGILLASLVVMLTGLIDDIYKLSPAQKMAGEIVGALIAVVCGLQFGAPQAFGIAILLAFFYLVFKANAMNLLDGMNGLAAGVAAIACLGLAGLAFLQGSNAVFVLALSLLGSVLGFLPHNFPRARVFMGDAGSLFLGFTLAGLGIYLSSQSGDPRVFLGVLLIMGLPALDTGAAFVRRLTRRADPFLGDREHIYDLLGRRFAGNLSATLLTWFWAALFGLVGLHVTLLPLASGLALTAGMATGSLVCAIALGAFGPRARASA